MGIRITIKTPKNAQFKAPWHQKKAIEIDFLKSTLHHPMATIYLYSK